MRSLRIALAQLNPTVGDLDGNFRKLQESLRHAKSLKTDILAFPELAITGYPPEDLLLKPQFIDDNIKILEKFVKEVTGLVAVVGFIDKKDDIYDAAAVMYDKKIKGIYHKMYLPNYGVFDENRYFAPGTEQTVYQWGDVKLGINVCEDIWYANGPASIQSFNGAELLVNISASPYHRGKGKVREQMMMTRASDNGVFVAYCNQVGGQDELVFDGHSLLCGPKGNLIASGKPFAEDFVICDIDLDDVQRTQLHSPLRRKQKKNIQDKNPSVKNIVISKTRKSTAKPAVPKTKNVSLDPVQEVYEGLRLGIKDYVSKNGFGKVVIGLSGGIDSALVAVLAVDALGKENVTGVFMPSEFSSKDSLEDAEQLAKNLGIRFQNISITKPFSDYLQILSRPFENKPRDVTEENLQARIRGNLLMALSNKFGCLVLTTGNKSEMSTGYATLYGDMAGGFAVIKDVPKTLVYELAKYINQKENTIRIPERIITKEPTAELRPNQKDTDSLPPYDVLDPILQAYVEEDKSYREIVEQGFDKDTVKKVIRLVDTSEYKRRQAPPGIKITPRAFGKDRRMPITNRYKGF